MKYAVNCSIVFTELPLLDRPAAAKAAGFEAVEFWWPWNVAVPPEGEVAGFVTAIQDSGVQLVGLNFFAGDLAGGERGLVSWKARSAEFRANVPVALAIGNELGCAAFNALYGNRQPDEDPQGQDACAIENLAFAAESAAEIDAVVLLEPISGSPAYLLKTAADVMATIERVRQTSGSKNIRLLCDLYHLATNGDDLEAVFRQWAGEVGHCQIADVPGRGEPGSGTLPFQQLLNSLHEHGYDGWVALEYAPKVPSSQSFGGLPLLPAGTVHAP